MSDIITPKWRDRLGEELRTFDDNVRPLLVSQVESFRCCETLMREQPLSLLQCSKKHRYGRQRAQNLLLSIFNNLCPELFLLCALALPVSDLSRTTEKCAVPNLRDWWKTVDHPIGLKETANALCKELFDSEKGKNTKRTTEDDVVGAAKVPSLAKVRGLLYVEPRKRKTLSVAENAHISNSPHTPLTMAEVSDNLYPSSRTDRMGLHKVSHESLITINLKDLIHFLIQYQQEWPDLVVKCP